MKKEDNAEIIEDLGPDTEPEKSKIKLELLTIILGISLLVISILFFYLLSIRTGVSLGIAQILFVTVIALVATLLFRWIKSFMTKNPYLGLIIGLMILGASIYSLRLRFQGPYTNTFSIIIALVVLAYLFINFWKSKKEIIKG